MSTIKDIAARAGVSIATVSCALSGSKPVKESTRKKIMKAAEELNYIPNASARNLKAQSTRTIGIILNDIKSKFHSDLFISLSAEFQKNGYMIEVAFSNDQPAIEQVNIDRMLSKKVDGLILLSCQTNASEYFANRLLGIEIPILFIERSPGAIPVNYIGYDNYRTLSEVTFRLLDKGYRNLALFCGSPQYSSEKNCARGFFQAFVDHQLSVGNSRIYHIDMTKDAAFQQGLITLVKNQPEVILCTSREITDGILLAAKYLDLKVPDNITIISIGEESWDTLSYGSGIHVISRSSTEFGEKVAQKMLELLNNPLISDTLFLEMEDQLPDSPGVKEAASLTPYINTHMKGTVPETLRILTSVNPSMIALQQQSLNFERKTGIHLEFTWYPQEELMKKILEQSHDKECRYDILAYDCPWLPYLYQNYCLADLREYVDISGYDLKRCFPELHRNVVINDKLYGIPISAGSQILFYRKDFFDDPTIQAAYREQFNISLRPPRTWTEFNNIARFFTRKYNPGSPTEYGISISGVDVALTPEILIRIWSLGGAAWDNYGYPMINSPSNVNAYRNLREAFSYAMPDSINISLMEAVENFIRGRSAMLITFSEYASVMGKVNRETLFKRVGFYHVPGNITVAAGWNFGMNPFTPKREAVFKYFSWLNDQNTSFFMTIMNGSPQFKASYHNHELTHMYPWLSCTEESIRTSRSRLPVYRRTRLQADPEEQAALLSDAMRKILQNEDSIENILDKAQEEAVRIYIMYGNPKRTAW